MVSIVLLQMKHKIGTNEHFCKIYFVFKHKIMFSLICHNTRYFAMLIVSVSKTVHEFLKYIKSQKFSLLL